MKALDTNVLVRFLIGDEARQANKVHAVFKSAESRKVEYFVPLLVVMELLWVLDSAYGIPRRDIVDSIHELVSMPILKFESHEAITKFIQSAAESDFDLPDLLIACSAKSSGCDKTLTFDKKASKFELFELLD